MTDALTHNELCIAAVGWALRRGFQMVRAEIELFGCGIADAAALGIIDGRKRGALFEAKTTRSDFLRDGKKWHRRHEDPGDYGIGERYYVAPPGLLRPDEMPGGWGLLEAEPGRRPGWVDDEVEARFLSFRLGKRPTVHEVDALWWAHLFGVVAVGVNRDHARTAYGLEVFSPGVVQTVDGMASRANPLTLAFEDIESLKKADTPPVIAERRRVQQAMRLL